MPQICSHSGTYRNPLIFARELHDQMLGNNLTRKQLAERYKISSDRVTQWLCLLKLPEETQKQIEALEDTLRVTAGDIGPIDISTLTAAWSGNIKKIWLEFTAGSGNLSSNVRIGWVKLTE